MATSEEIAQALFDGGYLSDADIAAASAVLEDALIIAAANDVQEEAAVDYSEKKDLVAEAQVWESEDAAVGDLESAVVDEEIVEEAQEQKEVDKEVMVEVEVVIQAAYTDAAVALLAAELIDEAYLEAVASTIAEAWNEEGD